MFDENNLDAEKPSFKIFEVGGVFVYKREYN
jgi:phenylalanyl-tRNA synthetase beta subunit